MPTQRQNGRYYIRRRVPGFGKMCRSLGTEVPREARRREYAVLEHAHRGNHGFVEAWLEDQLAIEHLVLLAQQRDREEILSRLQEIPPPNFEGVF